MSVIFDGTEGSPLASMAQRETRNVWHAGKEPPVEDCEIIPITGAPAPVALNSFNGSLPVTVMAARTPCARLLYVSSISNVHSPGNSASLLAAWIWYGAHAGPSGMA